MDPHDLSAKAQQLRNSLPPPRQPAAPPPERGKRLGTLSRGEEEIRITWEEYQGRPYLSIRYWVRGSGNHLWPDKNRGVTVRLHELADFTDALAQAFIEASKEPTASTAKPAAPRPVPPRPAAAPARPRSNYPPPRPPAAPPRPNDDLGDESDF